MKRTTLYSAAAGGLALVSGLLGQTPGLALAFDGHNAQGRPCWATRGTDATGFHAAELDCVLDRPSGSTSATKQQPVPAPPRPTPTPIVVVPVATAVPVEPVPPAAIIQPYQPDQTIQPFEAPAVQPAPPAASPASDTAPLASSATNGDPYSAESGVTLSVDSHFSVFSNKFEYNADVSGLDPATYDRFKSVALVLLDSSSNPVWTDYPGVDASGHFRWALPIGLLADTYHLGLVDVNAQSVLAQVAFTAADTGSAAQANDAAPPTTSLVGTWDLHLGVSGGTIILNEDGTYADVRNGAGGTWTQSGTDVIFTGTLEAWNNGHATLTSGGWLEFKWKDEQGYPYAFQLTRRR
jgi:hypothetical protein